jgi:hypothetical protein
VSAAASNGSSGALLGAAAVLVWNDVAPEGRTPFYEWHDKEHIPERLAIPGFRRGRRYARAGHSPQWLTFYEADSVDVLVSPAYMARLNAPTPATTRTLAYFRNTSRAVCRLVHSSGTSSGGHAFAMRLDASAGHADDVRRCIVERLFPRVMALTGVLAAHLYAADQPSSRLDTAESSTRRFDVPAWVVLLEASTESAAAQAGQAIDTDALAALNATPRDDACVYALEICRLAQPDPSSIDRNPS